MDTTQPGVRPGRRASHTEALVQKTIKMTREEERIWNVASAQAGMGKGAWLRRAIRGQAEAEEQGRQEEVQP